MSETQPVTLSDVAIDATLGRLEIFSEGKATGTIVKLDGVEQKALIGVDVHIKVGEPVTATLHYHVYKSMETVCESAEADHETA